MLYDCFRIMKGSTTRRADCAFGNAPLLGGPVHLGRFDHLQPHRSVLVPHPERAAAGLALVLDHGAYPQRARQQLEQGGALPFQGLGVLGGREQLRGQPRAQPVRYEMRGILHGVHRGFRAGQLAGMREGALLHRRRRRQ